MSTNPNNAVGTNAAYDGRTSVKAFNDGIGAYSRGILSGWACSPNTGMTVSLGGNGTTRDIAIAEDVAGNKITVNNISEAPISVTMSAAPATNSRIDLIVAYVDNPPQGSSTSIDNPGACGLIAVEGTAAADPVAPNDSAIRTAITADGASGATAYYVVLATITIASGTTDLTSDNIKAGVSSTISGGLVDFSNTGLYEELGRFVLGSTSAPSGTIVLKRSAPCLKIVAFGAPNETNARLQVHLNGDTSPSCIRNFMQRSENTTDWFTDNIDSILNFSVSDDTYPAFGSNELYQTSNGWAGFTNLSRGHLFRIGSCSWTSSADVTYVTIGTSSNSIWKAGLTVIVYGHD